MDGRGFYLRCESKMPCQFCNGKGVSCDETLYNTKRYTTKDGAVYVINLEWPQGNVVTLGSPSLVELFTGAGTPVVTLLGDTGFLDWSLGADQVQIEFPDKAAVKSETGWVIKITS